MADYDDVCVLVPTYNEAETIGDVVDGFHDEGLTNVLVIDGGSTDGTDEIAREHGARVVQQSGSGKGQAVREALGLIEAPYVLMIDGDATYRPEEADRLLDPLLAGEADHVVGNRFANMESGAMSRLNRAGNRIINRAFRYVHGRELTDILSGYRAFTLPSVERFSLSSDGFGIETELSVECVKHGVPTAVVPITYRARPEESQTNLRPFRDGAIILLTLYQMAKTNNPLFYFGSVGVLSLLAGAVLGVYVGIEWFVYSISHEILALVSGVSILLGIQLVMFGVLSDLIVTLNREQTRRVERLAEALEAGESTDRSNRPTGNRGAEPEVGAESDPPETRPDR
ncbi:MAG: S-layer glycoprotein N-glycosyltransferase AglJ [Haloarculaceae archaeon]